MPGIILPRPEPTDYAPVFEAEISLVPTGVDFVDLLRRQVEETGTLVDEFGEGAADLRYAPGKWTVREVIGHLGDCERVLSYRLLRFLRQDATPLSGFDHEAYVPAGRFERRTLGEHLAGFRAVRHATIALVGGAPPAAFTFRGRVGAGTITAAALAYLIAGHERHHQERLRTDYLPLLPRQTAPAP